MSRGAKYFAVDIAPTESLPPSPVADSLHRVSEMAHRALDATRGFERRLARLGQAHSRRRPIK